MRDARPADRQPTEPAAASELSARARTLTDSATEIARSSAATAKGSFALAQRVTYWPATLCVIAAILLQVRLPGKLVAGPSWLLPVLEGALLAVLAVTRSWARADEHSLRRRLTIALIAIVNVANALSLYLLAHQLLHRRVANGHGLILSGIVIWLTNVLIFGLWYWQIDRGGPANRVRHPDPTTPEGRPDFIFPEMDTGKPFNDPDWAPSFVDYLVLAVTTATAFSPTDTMPNSKLAKTLMGAQGLVSLVTLGLIISRAVGILN